MPVVIFFTCLDLEQKSSVMDGHCLVFKNKFPPNKPRNAGRSKHDKVNQKK